ncbi:hypothetical protein HKX48_002306, partial [Thoreauomyces humboldtii]
MSFGGGGGGPTSSSSSRLPAPQPPPKTSRFTKLICIVFLAYALLRLRTYLTYKKALLTPPSPAPISTGRIVAIGDLHGDYANALTTFRIAGLVDGDGKWVGGDATFVQTGDVVDRGPDTIRLYRWLQDLADEARDQGGEVVTVLGNHEVMNMANDLRYVTPEDTASFGGPEKRAQAWSRDGWLGQYVRTWNVTVQIEGTVFLHGGLHPKWAALGLDTLNDAASRALHSADPDDLAVLPLFHGDGPLWYRGYAQDDEAVVCPLLKEALGFLN